METENNQETLKENLAKEILNHYQEHLLLKGEEPASIFAFCKDMDIEESDFYQYYNDFTELGGAFWLTTMNKVKDAMVGDAEFENFSAREKLLSYYYGFFEELKKSRSYALLSIKESTSLINKEPKNLKSLKNAFKEWAKELVSEGINNGEIAGRFKISDSYDNVFWIQYLFLIQFWIKDDSKSFEKSDVAIEKAVNFSFDMIEKNALDSAIDFGKFLFQNR